MLTKRQRHEFTRIQLEQERSSFLPLWSEVADYTRPTRYFNNAKDQTRGDRRNQKIIDSTAAQASRTLRSGMMAGHTSPSRDWKHLTTPDKELAEHGQVKNWLYDVNDLMSTVFLQTNLYNVLPILYGDMGDFSTSATLLEEDANRVLRLYSIPLGTYCLATDGTGKPNTFTREYPMTVKQLVDTFGDHDKKTGKPNWDRFSMQVKNLYEQGQYQIYIDVIHVICPNPDWNPHSPFSIHKKFESCYYEKGNSTAGVSNYMTTADIGKYLRESGFDYFPVLAPRWEVSGASVYGVDCPGFQSLGDNKQLQIGEKRAAQAIEKMVTPPMQGGPEFLNRTASFLPGGLTVTADRNGGGLRPIHEVNLRIAELEGKQDQVRNRIKKAYYEDLFLMMTETDRREITATEIAERKEEKLLALGPVLEQLNQDLLDPLIDITFDIMIRQGRVPPPPEELQGMPLKVEYISVMAQAQKLIGLSGLERYTNYVAGVAAFDQSILRKFNAAEAADEYAEIASIKPTINRTNEEVAAMAQAEAQAAAQARQAENVAKSTAAIKNLSQADLEGENALSAALKGGRQ